MQMFPINFVFQINKKLFDVVFCKFDEYNSLKINKIILIKVMFGVAGNFHLTVDSFSTIDQIGIPKFSHSTKLKVLNELSAFCMSFHWGMTTRVFGQL